MKKINLLYTIYYILFTIFAVYSYSFLDIGLTLTSFKPYLEFQKKIRWWGYFNKGKSTLIFIFLTCLLFTVYCLLSCLFKKKKIIYKKNILFVFFIFLILIFSYPAFSHDIFNYIFNAKMVLIYHTNPHIHSAWEFKDSMLGFMRNIHTPAPYFYGWTVLSLIPFVLGLNRIFLEIISFKIFSAFLFLFSFVFLKKILKKLDVKDKSLRLALFLLNPLILIEVAAIGHNDFSMMAPALLSFYFLIKHREKRKLFYILYFMFFILYSLSTKYATVVLLPLFLIWFYKKDFDIGLWGAILLFLLPFIRPLNQLHSWYLIWPLTWVFLSKNIKAVYFFCFLSFFALLRYAPYIWYGNWDLPVLKLRLLIYFLIPAIFLIYWIGKQVWSKIRFNGKR